MISNSGQNACLAPSSARSLLREFKRSQTLFSGHKCINNVWRPGSARTRWGSLSAPPDPLAAVGDDNYNLQPQFSAYCGEGGGGMDVRGMGRDELEEVFQNPTSSVISNSGKNACLAPSSERSLLREFKRSQTSFSGHKCIKNVWQPGSARTR